MEILKSGESGFRQITVWNSDLSDYSDECVTEIR